MGPLVEVVAVLSLATDVGMGQPFGHAIRSSLLALRFADRLRLDEAVRAEIVHVALLRWAGCTSHAHDFARFFDDEIDTHRRSVTMDFASIDPMAYIIRHAGQGRGLRGRLLALFGAISAGPGFAQHVFSASCEVAQSLARELGTSEAVVSSLGDVFERWDGRGSPNGLRGARIAFAARLVQVAQDWAAFRELGRLGGADLASSVLRQRAGNSLDPELSHAFARCASELETEVDGAGDAWDQLLATEPDPYVVLDAHQVERSLKAIGEFADLKLTFTIGQSSETAQTVSLASRQLGFDPVLARCAHWAALITGAGRVSVPNGIWEQARTLTGPEWECVRLYPYHTGRVFARTRLAREAEIGSMQHERSDGSGYFRGSRTEGTSTLLQPTDARLHSPTLTTS